MSPSNSRWIRVQTSIFDHYLFDREPFSEREAWLWLVARAAWKDTRHKIGPKSVSVPAGSLFTTLRELQKVWKWKSDTRVRTFLKMLTDELMIITDADAGKTQITICNYDEYQRPERTINAEETRSERAKAAQKVPVLPNHTDSEEKRERENDVDLEEFQGWFRAYPTYLTDKEDAARDAWLNLTAKERSAVMDLTPRYLEGAKATRRTMYPSAANFLAQRHWERILFMVQPDEKPKKTPQSSLLPESGEARAAPQTREEYIRLALANNDKPWD